MPNFEILSQRIFLIIIFITFLLLLYKNPFSERNLIPNLEPFPDTIHYLNPPLSFLEGKGFVIEREGRILIPAVPFLYPASLIPGFILNNDARFFYFTNLIFALSAMVFFYKFLLRLINSFYINLFILFLYVTNYFIYWYPNLPMAENLILLLYSIGLYLLISKPSLKNAFVAGFLGVSFYATKYAGVSLTLTFLLFYFVKTSFNLLNKRSKGLQVLAAFILSTIVGLSIFFILDYLIRGNNIFLQLLEHFNPLVKSQISQTPSQPSNSSWFSFMYFTDHLKVYLGAIIGIPMRFLWDFTPLIPRYIGLFGIAGILVSMLVNKYRFIGMALLMLILVPTIAISPFYTTDARYIYHVIPSLLAGFGLFLMFTHNLFVRLRMRKIFFTFLISLFIFYAANNFYRLKYQIVLNLKYAETPWYYISVKETNNFFREISSGTSQKKYLISALPPYFIDFYSNGLYTLLPLSNEQEFRKRFNVVFGEDNYSDLILLYERKLKEGNAVFLSSSGLSEGYLRETFKKITEYFDTQKTHSGCFDACNIYRLNLKF